MRDSQKGSVLLIVIAGITILAAIGAGVATMVGSGARTGADHSLSVQAIYAAESGLEWARFKLREAHNDPGDSWENYCQNALTSEGSDVNIGGQVFFSIDGANLSPVGGPPYDGCEVSVTGWVGQNKNTPLAKREIPGQGQGKILKTFIENDPAVVPGATPEPDDTSYYAVSSAEKSITLPYESSVDGNVYGKGVTLSSKASVTGDVTSEDFVELGSRSSVDGDICASGNVTMADRTEVGGDIHAHGDVTVGWKSKVEGDIFATGTVTLESEAEVSGSIHSESSVTVGWDSEVEGSVFAKGAVTLEGDARVSGSIHSESPVTLGWQDTVEGDVISEGSIDMSGGKNLIDGNAAASGQITLGWKSKITGTQSEFDPDPGVISPEPPQTCPEVSAPSQSIFSAGTTDMSFGWKQDGIIEPGNYRDLSAGGKNKLYFKRNAPGQCEYVFNSISLAWDVDIYLDLSQCEENGEPGDITIFSEDDIDFGGKMEIYIITEDGSEQKMKDVDPEVAKRIYWETYDDFSQGSSSEWFGTILAGDDISFDSTGMEMIGAAASVNGTVTMGSSADVTYIPANYAVENW